MKHFFYPRLAFTNIKKNAKLYIPYLITSMFTVSMYYIMHSLSVNTSFINDPNSSGTLLLVLNLGSWVMMVFSIIFLFYINSFLIKRRKKEIALYNILGMEKRHVMIMMFCETFITTLISIVGGLLLGLLLSKLAYLFLVNLIHVSTAMAFEISIPSVIQTLCIFIPIYIAAYLFNVVQVKVSNPIELLRGGEVGERQLKSKWILTIFGLIALGAGYYIAQNTQDPIMALMLFFVAVILVIIGTYCLFTAGSISILNLLKKNKKFYYQTRHFTSVSQMMYRMKQNAVGLASICILYTCILVMLSSTVSLYVSIQDSAELSLDEHIKVVIDYDRDQDTNKQNQLFKEKMSTIETQLQDKGIEIDTYLSRKETSFFMSVDGYKVTVGHSRGSDTSLYTGMNAMSEKDYNEAYDKNVSLKEDEVLVRENFMNLKDTIDINGKTYKVKGVVKDRYFIPTDNTDYARWLGVVFKDDSIVEDVMQINTKRNSSVLTTSIMLKDKENSKEAVEIIGMNLKTLSGVQTNVQSQYGTEVMFTEMYGSLFFLGIFLGVIFLIAAILIMYYKQLSEGYEDQKRFEIMQNVGMSKKEVKQSIRSQILIFFFLPLAVSVLHMVFAFRLIVRMFSFLVLSGESVFIWCTVIAIAVLVVIYSIVYFFTSRTYYKIVKN